MLLAITAELLQLLVDIFAVMDEAMGCDVREAEREVLMHKLLTFLNILKYTMPPDEDEREQVPSAVMLFLSPPFIAPSPTPHISLPSYLNFTVLFLCVYVKR